MKPRPEVDDAAARLAVWPATPELAGAARALADELGLPLCEAPPSPAQADLVLVLGAAHLELRETAPRGAAGVTADFTGGAVDFRRRRGGGRRDPVARALGIGAGTRRIVDATAGLGRDAFLFAWLGCEVVAMERSPVVRALLRDALQRARSVPEVDAIVTPRLAVLAGDARELLAGLPEDERPDAIYIDPMFPPRRASALAGKEMRVLRRVVGSDGDAAELLAVARRVARRRVVVKRHARAPALGGTPPDFTSAGRSTRFDVYLVHGASA